MINHACEQWNSNPEEWDQDHPEPNVVDVISRQDSFRRQEFNISRFSFQLYMVALVPVKITN